MATIPKDSKYCDIVESYLQNRLPHQEFHPSFQHLSERPEINARRPLRAYSQTDPDLPVLLVPKDEESEGSDESGADLSMYLPCNDRPSLLTNAVKRGAL